MKQILVIEDTAAVREEILDLLDFEGFDAIGAPNGAAGVQLALEHHPDLILCDIMMPELDGYGVLTQLRQEPATATTPFIFLTANAAKEDMREGMELGADDYITKPFLGEELLAAIQARLTRHAAMAQQGEQTLEALRGHIIHAMPHELLTPLNGIWGFAQLLVNADSDMSSVQVSEIGTEICQAANRLHRLVQNFLTLAQIKVLAADPKQLAALRQQSTVHSDALITMAATHQAEIAQRCEGLVLRLLDTSAPIEEGHLQKIVDELVDNAFKFSTEGAPVTVTTLKTPAAFVLEVRNQGRGLAADQIASIGACMQLIAPSMSSRARALASPSSVASSSSMGASSISIAPPMIKPPSGSRYPIPKMRQPPCVF